MVVSDAANGGCHPPNGIQHVHTVATSLLFAPSSRSSSFCSVQIEVFLISSSNVVVAAWWSPACRFFTCRTKEKKLGEMAYGSISSYDVPQGTYGGGLKRILVPHKKRIDCRMHSILCPSLSLASCRVSWSQRVLRSLKKIWRTARHFLRVSPLFPYRPLAFFLF